MFEVALVRSQANAHNLALDGNELVLGGGLGSALLMNMYPGTCDIAFSCRAEADVEGAQQLGVASTYLWPGV
ncbi:hypothetical protein ACIBQ1_26035 [Nonomuraea sp. NPDC050153]|uniref:hypothetical protein n=1 Tax=Nonomuraea sp. NPDC050153 TaxID=3364359 RepID=UPI003789DA06